MLAPYCTQYVLSLDSIHSAVRARNRELVLRFSTDLSHNGVFYASNGFEMVERHRSPATSPLPSNFYPSVSGARLAGFALFRVSSCRRFADLITCRHIESLFHCAQLALNIGLESS